MFGRYLAYLGSSKTRFRVHSPFVYQLIENVFRKQPSYYAFKKIERSRDELLEDSREVLIEDFGAGSRRKKNQRIKDIANNSLSPQLQSEWLFGLANYFKAKTIVELGTSFGVSTAYLASASSASIVHTFEGSKALLDIAKGVWKKLKLNNITAVEGKIEDTLPYFLQGYAEPIDLIYIDANHTYEATLLYFRMLQPFLTDTSVIVIDDIHWSKGMERAWEELIAQSEISISIDLFYKGILFFRKEIEKEHFILRV